LITAATAGAQTGDPRTAARAAADAGADAYDAGKYEEAADLFTRAERLLHAPPHLLYAARSHAKLGHLVEAREFYLTLVRERLGDDAPRVFREAQQAGDKELTELEARIPYVSVVVQGMGASSVRVTRNGDTVPSELIGVPHPVDPGEHRYQAYADGMESTPTTVLLKEGVRETVVLTLNAVAGGAASQGAVSGSSLSSAGGSTEDAPSRGGRPLLIGALVGFGVAAVGAGLGTYFIVSSGGTRSDADDMFSDCRPRGCSEEEKDEIATLDGDADTQRDLGIGSFVIGGVGLAAGVTLLLVDSGRSSARDTRGIRPVVGLGYAGVAGAF
jgi:hypothetical protein